MQTYKSDTVMIDQAYAKKLVYTVMQGWEIKGKNSTHTKKPNSDVTGNLWYKAKR